MTYFTYFARCPTKKIVDGKKRLPCTIAGQGQLETFLRRQDIFFMRYYMTLYPKGLKSYKPSNLKSEFLKNPA